MAVLVKICGITNPADAAQAAKFGADLIGLNFYARSPRYIDEATARSILQTLPGNVEPVALFVNEPLTHVQQVSHALSIGTAQWHGDLPESVSIGIAWIPAFPVRDAASLTHILARLERWRALGTVPRAILVDAHVPGQYGGTGQAAPWNLLADFNPGVPLILAGGLTPENVADAVRIVRPYAVDVASGVESSPGKKDYARMQRFIDAAHAG